MNAKLATVREYWESYQQMKSKTDSQVDGNDLPHVPMKMSSCNW